jgi:Ca-activated chloride channel family protein
MTPHPPRRRALAALALAGLCAGCLPAPVPPGPESALLVLETSLLPGMRIDSVDPVASGSLPLVPASLPLAERLPVPEAYPLQAVDPRRPPAAGSLRLEIVSSAEKADGARPDRRWLVEVAERFNRRQERTADGRRIELAIRTIPSGLAAQMIAAGRLRPAGYSPASEQWLALLQRQGVSTALIHKRLVGNGSVIALRRQAWQRLGVAGEPQFGAVVEQTLAGRLRFGFCNPYICSPGLDFLHTLLWRSAGHGQGRQPLTQADLQSEAVQRSFAVFQQRLSTTTPTYLEQVESWRRRPEAFDAVVMAQQSFLRLQREPGFADLVALPFGTPQDSPLVALPWTRADEREALARFAAFATAAPQQDLARQWEFSQPLRIPPALQPPPGDGEVMRQAQGLWKRRKDGNRTVYLQLLIDRSGSMRQHDRMRALQNAVTHASAAINPGNQVGLISFANHPTRHLPLQPYDETVRARLLAAVHNLRPEGSTALYDGLAVAMADLLQARRLDPEGRFVVLLLTDGQRTSGLDLETLRPLLRASDITVIPIAYGEVNQRELQEIAALWEGAVVQGSPAQIVPLMNDLLQTNL